MYYTIKCVHCMERLKSNEVVYKISLDDMEISKTYPKSNKNDSESFDGGVSISETDPFGGGMGGGSLLGSMGNSSNSSQKYMTISQIAQEPDLVESVAPIEKPVFVSQKVYNDEKEDGSLTVGCEVKKLVIDDTCYDGVFKKRRCPYCKELLLKEAGTMPTYIIGMFGHSTAGKTVFLTMQCFSMLFNTLNLNVPHGELLLEYTVSHLESSRDVILDSANEFETTGLFPSTTGEIPVPHCLIASYRRRRKDGNFQASNTNSCLVSFQDIMGELMTEDITATAVRDNEEAYEKMVRFYKKCDGLIIITDPMVLAKPTTSLLHQAIANKATTSSVRQTMLTISNVLTESRTESEKRPTVSLITKEDTLVANKDTLEISNGNSAIASGFSMAYEPDCGNWAENNFQKINRDTKKLLKYLDNNGSWSKMLETKFVNAVYIPISSIGQNVRIIPVATEYEDGATGFRDKLVTIDTYNEFHNLSKDEQVKNSKKYIEEAPPINLIKSRFIELPILYFMMEFGIIPPMHKSEFYPTQPVNHPIIGIIGNLFGNRAEENPFDIWIREHSQRNENAQ